MSYENEHTNRLQLGIGGLSNTLKQIPLPGTKPNVIVPPVNPAMNNAAAGVGAVNPGQFTQAGGFDTGFKSLNVADLQGGGNYGYTAQGQNALGVRDPGLGDKGMSFQNKMNMGLNIANVGIGSLLGFQAQRLAQKQFKDQQRLANINLQRQTDTMKGELSREYSLAAHPELLAKNENAYHAKYGLV